MSETEYTRQTALDAVEAARAGLTNTQSNALAGVVRDLWDGYPVADARSALKAAEYSLPYEVFVELRTVLAATVDDTEE